MKATEQYVPVVLFIMQYKVILTLESVDEILESDHSNESCYDVLSFNAVCFPLFRKMYLALLFTFQPLHYSG